MKLPIEGRMPQAANEIVVSRSLIWELEKDGEKNPTSVQLGDQTFQITGIYEQLPFEPVYTQDQMAKANQSQYHRFSFISVPKEPNYRVAYIKCIAGQEQNVRKEILKIVHNWLPASIPFLLTTKQEERFRLNGGEMLISDLFSLLSVISIVITVLGIYSAITLDTVAGKKKSPYGKSTEPALRSLHYCSVNYISVYLPFQPSLRWQSSIWSCEY